MASCKDCLCEIVCKYNDGVNEYCKGNCPHFKDRTRFVELPCKIGEYLYRIKTVRGKKIITETQLSQNTFWRIVFGREYGKTVFLTREEAEKALNGLENPNSRKEKTNG